MLDFYITNATICTGLKEPARKGLMNESGGSGIFLTNPVNDFFQDIRAARGHYANNPDKPGRNFGSVKMGLKNTDFFI